MSTCVFLVYRNAINFCVLITQLCSSLWPHGLQPARLFCPWNSPGKNTEVGCHFLLQGIFPTQGSNPSLLHCRQILSHLSHQTRLLHPWDFPGKSTGVDCHFLLQGIFPTQGSNQGSAVHADALPSDWTGKPQKHSKRNQQQKIWSRRMSQWAGR